MCECICVYEIWVKFEYTDIVGEDVLCTEGAARSKSGEAELWTKGSSALVRLDCADWTSGWESHHAGAGILSYACRELPKALG